MDPDSFKGKLLISVVDKLLIGLAATLVVVYVQWNQRQADLVNQARIAVARVLTDEVADQRSRFVASVSEFLDLVAQLRVLGIARDENAVRLRQLVRDIRGSVAVLQSIHSARVEHEEATACQPRDNVVLDEFIDLINSGLAGPLLSGRMDPDAVSTKLNDTVALYPNTLEFMRCLAVDMAHYEVVHAQE